MFNGRVAVVTGASRGIGRAVAENFGARGANLILCATDSNAVQIVAKKISETHKVKAIGIAVDVSLPGEVSEFYKKVFKEFKRLDILVNNAGILGDGLIGMIDDETIDRTIDTNLKGVIYNTRSASRLMRRKKAGVIVNVSSVVGVRGNSGQLVYAASKSAILGLTYSAAKELATDNIRVNAVAPGYIDTDMIGHLSKDVHDLRVQSIASGRVGTPKEVAECVSFLASDMASYVTGQVLGVDGGILI